MSNEPAEICGVEGCSGGEMRTREPLAETEEVAEFMKLPPRTLDQWAHQGKGPRFFRVGRHRRYRWSDVDAWLDQQSGGGEKKLIMQNVDESA